MELTKKVVNLRCLSYSICNLAVFSLSTKMRQRHLAFGRPRQEVVTKKTQYPEVDRSKLLFGVNWGPARVTIKHLCLLKNLGSIFLLRQEYASGSTRGRYTKKIIQWTKVCHSKFRMKRIDDTLHERSRRSFPTLERVTIGCCEVGGGGGGGVIGGFGVVCGVGVNNEVGGVVCGFVCGVVFGVVVFVEENWSHGAEGKDSFVKCDMTRNDDFVGVQVKAPIFTMIVSVPEKDRWCGTRGKFVRWKGVRVTKASQRAKNFFGEYVACFQSNNAREVTRYEETFEKRWASLIDSRSQYMSDTRKLGLREKMNLSLEVSTDFSYCFKLLEQENS
ncbi:hypothetical protein Tco_1183826 [Tanacetum coccineum]